MIDVRSVGFVFLIGAILIAQLGFTYAAVYAACPKPGQTPAEHDCCPAHEQVPPSDPCQKVCDLGDEDVPAVTRSSDLKVGKNTTGLVVLNLAEAAPLVDQPEFAPGGVDRLAFGSKAYLLNTCLLI